MEFRFIKLQQPILPKENVGIFRSLKDHAMVWDSHLVLLRITLGVQKSRVLSDCPH